MNKIYDCNELLPMANAYVLGWYDGGDHWDTDTPTSNGPCWKVVKFVRGLSAADREDLPERCERRLTIRTADEWGNNQRPYCWSEFGPATYFGQDITHWTHLPRNPPGKASPVERAKDD